MTAAELKFVEMLMEQNRSLTEQVVELAKEALRSNVTAPLPAPQPIEAYDPFKLTVPETEQDARAMAAAGLLDDKELEAVLNEIGFMNAEMVIPTA